MIASPINESALLLITANRKKRFASVTTLEHRMLRFEREDDLELYVDI